MNALQIELEMEKCVEAAEIFKGVYPSDAIPVFNKKPYAIICNTQPSNLPGEHWVSFYVGQDKIEFFDSYGRRPDSDMFPLSFKNFVKNKICYYNSRIVEGFFDNSCGHFCIYMLCLRARGLLYSEIINSFSVDVDFNRFIVLNFIK